MEFSKRKLPPEAAPQLRICPIETVKPYALMLAPVYVFMKANEKFVSVKAPLDFFNEQELARLKPFGNFFIPEFVDSVMPFRETARAIRALLTWQPKPKEPRPGKKPELFPEVPMPPAPYEASDAVLRLVGPLWGNGAVIEPFFVSVFANELCDLLPGDLLTVARDASVERYECAVFRSSWAVLLAVHLGYCDLGFLNRLRRRIFEETMGSAPLADRRSEVDELVEIVCSTLLDNKVGILRGDVFTGRGERVSQKLAARLERVKASFIRPEAPVATIYGQKGFVDVV